ncbi:MAG: phytoene/squalene synthase family protein [Pseudomonadota bacterium]
MISQLNQQIRAWQVDNSFENAKSVLANNGKSFAFAGSLLENKRLEACARLYRFCRYADDLVDETPNPAQADKKLSSLQGSLGAGYSLNPVINDFIHLSREHNLDHQVTMQLLQGLKSDLSLVSIETEGELLRYCYRVASTVGLHMCSIFKVDSPVALAHAIDLGIAMQLTNICRDVYEDAQQSRRYLPASLVGNLDSKNILMPTDQEEAGIRHGVLYLLSLADKYYLSATSGYQYLPMRARLAIAVAGKVYQGIGEQIKKREGDVWAGRAFVSLAGKYKRAMSALWALTTSRRDEKPHNSNLHVALRGLPHVNS